MMIIIASIFSLMIHKAKIQLVMKVIISRNLAIYTIG